MFLICVSWFLPSFKSSQRIGNIVSAIHGRDEAELSNYCIDHIKKQAEITGRIRSSITKQVGIGKITFRIGLTADFVVLLWVTLNMGKCNNDPSNIELISIGEGKAVQPQDTLHATRGKIKGEQQASKIECKR
jgi:hypothetical protein